MTAIKKPYYRRPPWRTVIPAAVIFLALLAAYHFWSPGLDVRDGRDDRSQNGIWISHAWLGADIWFKQNEKTNEIKNYRDATKIAALAENLRQHHIRDVFPHMCPSEPDGSLPPIDAEQAERFLDSFEGFRVIPWIGGPNGGNVRLTNAKWRTAFTNDVSALFAAHPRFAGVQLNVEPLTSGDTNFLSLLDDLRAVLPHGKILSVAAYPPPTWWQRSEDVHWDENYFREVARRSDQLAVMMYDVGQRIPKTYVKLMSDWTTEVLSWSEGKAVLLGVPTYDDKDSGYHEPEIENLQNALLGIHRGLSRQPVPANYQGVAIYPEWETSRDEWDYFTIHFLKP